MKLKIMLLFVAMVLVMMAVAAPAYAKTVELPRAACSPGGAFEAPEQGPIDFEFRPETGRCVVFTPA